MPVSATPSTKQAMDGPRLLVVFGSESGTCQMVANAAAKEFKAVCASVEVLEGNELAHEVEDLGELKEKYDALVVVTSSFGEGDPPSNYGAFLAAVMSAAKEGAKPLAGLQHAVLGEGSSVYRDTFQNCPRLTDKYLEEAGSRRFVARHETDVGGEEDEGVNRKLFREAVAAVLKKGLPAASAAPAAAWASPRAGHDEPTDQITEKTEFQAGHKQSLGQMLVPALAISVAAAAFVYTQYFMEDDGIVAE
jgi:sulfite reductase alpha subunit-like flavoprotein